MTVLTTIPNGASNKDIRDTLNQLLSDVAALKGGTSPTLPTLTLAGPLTYAANAAAGTLVAAIGNVPAGATPTLTPAGGRLVIAGNASTGWKVVTGMTASTAGTITLAVAASGATGASAAVTVTAATTSPGTGGGTPGAITIDPLVTRSGNDFNFTARRTTNIANAESHSINVAGSSTYAPGAAASDFGGAFPTAIAAFAAGSATAAFTITSANAIPE